MENRIFAKVGALVLRTQFQFFIFFATVSLILAGCASSAVERTAASNFDKGVQNAKTLAGGAGDTSIAATYQNASQTTKGILIGGAAGAIAGSVYSGLGGVPGAAIGALLGASYGSYIDSETTLKDQLENRGATVVVLGDQILIVLPSATVFKDMTSTIKPSAYSTLYVVAAYINRHTKMLVNIAAYTNETGSESVDLALTQEQANSLVKFFTATGMDARVLYGIGYGGTHLVSRNTVDWNHSDNYRIEITLERLYVGDEAAGETAKCWDLATR